MPMTSTTPTIAEAFSLQAHACRLLGSEYTADLLNALRTDLEAGGPTAELLADYDLPPVPSAMALRVAGGIHGLLLAGRVPALDRWYPLRGAAARDPAFAAALRAVVAAERDWLRDFLSHPVQTNEVARSAALAPGFMEIAARTGRPLSLREIGSSGGLNLLWDRFAYRFAGRDFGAPDAPVRLEPEWRGAAPPPAPLPTVLDRRGVDIHPLDLRDDLVLARGLAYLWPDQPERLERYRTAVELLRASDLRVETGSAPEWLETVLATPTPGATTVVFHSIMWQYMPPPVRAATESVIRSAGARADRSRLLAWLRFEPNKTANDFELTLDLWPGSGLRNRLATLHPHGAIVDWHPDVVEGSAD
ncbi:MAG: DUF2332 domain-containing protein [Pseudomonadota bacterium]